MQEIPENLIIRIKILVVQKKSKISWSTTKNIFKVMVNFLIDFSLNILWKYIEKTSFKIDAYIDFKIFNSTIIMEIIFICI